MWSPVETLHSNVDILLISKAKSGCSFPATQFKIEGYTTYRLDRNSNVGGMHPVQVPKWDATRWFPETINLPKLPPWSQITSPQPINE